MSGLDPHALDRWITGGRFSESRILVLCPDCEEKTVVIVSTEYGASEWNPAECSDCKREFSGEEKWEDDEPPEPEWPEDRPDEDREEMGI